MYSQIIPTALLLLTLCSTGTATANERIRRSPEPLRGGEHGVGTLMPAVTFEDLDGNNHSLAELATKHRAVVLAMTSTSCPLSLKYFPTLVSLSKEFAAKDVHFVIVNSVATDKVSAMEAAQERLGNSATYVFDKSGKFAKAVGAETTTDVIVIDTSRTVVYHGAIDDQYGFGYSKETPKNRYLTAALERGSGGANPSGRSNGCSGLSVVAHKDQQCGF